ncbi:SLC13 family permease [Desulfosarcina sp. OttesenSCG-928-G10]|nr:SLC13 family permease [Desulfosarcina sp. OttesenSCG-928-G10]
MENLHLIITAAILASAVLLLVTGWVRNDTAAALIILALMVTGVLTIPEALSGFSSHAVIIIACMFVIGEAIIHTGIAQRFGDAIIRYGGTSEIRLLIMIMICAATVGAFMSSTATAAIFIPITLQVAEKAGVNHRRLLMPLAAASLISGMMTLVATTPNIVVNTVLRNQGLEPLSFFSFTPFGLLALTLAILYMAFSGQNRLADRAAPAERKKGRSIDDIMRHYGIEKNEYLMRVTPSSALVGRTVAEMQIGNQHNVYLLAVSTRRSGKSIVVPAQPEVVFLEDDLILLLSDTAHAAVFANTFDLEQMDSLLMDQHKKRFFEVVGIADLMLAPDSDLIGKTLKATQFQGLYHCFVLGIRRSNRTLTENTGDIALKFGDVLLVCGAWAKIVQLGQNRESCILLSMPEEYAHVIPGKSKQAPALVIFFAMVGLIAFNICPPVIAILAATVALVMTRCVPTSSIYTVVDWPTVMLTAGILSLALALQQTGGIALVSDGFLAVFGQAGPFVVLAGLFLLTGFLGLFMTNTAIAVLLAPFAVDVGLKLGINPQACAMVVAIACSAAFISPFGSPVAMIVRAPGAYRIQDYVKVGVPLFFLCFSATLVLSWWFYL